MAEGLIDIGGGVRMINPNSVGGGGASAADTLSLVNMANQIKNAPLERQRLELQVQDALFQQQQQPVKAARERAEMEKVQIETQTKQGELLLDIYGQALSGDEAGATQKLRSLSGNPDLFVLSSADPKKRQMGIVQLYDQSTGKLTDYDLSAQDKVKANIDLQVDKAKKLVQEQMDIRKEDRDIRRTYPLDMLKNNQVSTLREGQEITESILMMSKPQDYNKVFGKDVGVPGMSKPITSLSDKAQGRVLKNAVDVRASIVGSENDPMNRDLSPKRNLDATQTLAIANGVTMVENLGEVVAPLFVELTNNSNLTKPGFLTAKVGDLAKKFSLQSSTLAALDVATTSSSFEEVVRLAGTTFTEEVQQKIQDMLPSRNDRLDVALAKMGGMMALSTKSTLLKVEALETSKYDVSRTMEMIKTRFDIPEMDSVFNSNTEQRNRAVAKMILNKLPNEIKGNSQLMGAFLSGLPGAIRTESMNILAKDNKVPLKSIEGMTNNIFGIGN